MKPLVTCRGRLLEPHRRFGPPAPGQPGARRQGDEQGQTLPLSGTVYERVLRTQQIDGPRSRTATPGSLNRACGPTADRAPRRDPARHM
jgi:hypothetical protein